MKCDKCGWRGGPSLRSQRLMTAVIENDFKWCPVCIDREWNKPQWRQTERSWIIEPPGRLRDDP